MEAENTNIEKKDPVSQKKATPAIGYRGEVKAKIQKGKKTLYTRTFYNHGLPLFFENICKALVGEWYSGNMPGRIALFSKKDLLDPWAAYDSLIDPTNFKWTDFINASRQPEYITLPVNYTTTPVLERLADGSQTVTFQFRIPYTLITDSEVYLLVLLPRRPANGGLCIAELRQALAYYLCVTEEDGVMVWDPIQLDSSFAAEYSLLVEWTMKFTNIETIESGEI